MSVYLILGIVFALAVALFAVANTEPVTINFLVNQLQTSLALVIVGSAAAGALVIGIFGAVRQLQLRLRMWDRENRLRRSERQAVEWERRARELEAKVAALQAELEAVKAEAAQAADLLQEREAELTQLREALAGLPAAAEDEPTPGER